jgi:hypothetical protein
VKGLERGFLVFQEALRRARHWGKADQASLPLAGVSLQAPFRYIRRRDAAPYLFRLHARGIAQNPAVVAITALAVSLLYLGAQVVTIT